MKYWLDFSDNQTRARSLLITIVLYRLGRLNKRLVGLKVMFEDRWVSVLIARVNVNYENNHIIEKLTWKRDES